jgi:hypothetical protein
MIKLFLAVMGLIVLVLVAGAHAHFDPSWPILGILCLGLVAMGIIGDPTRHPKMPRSTKHAHWGSGQGIYFDPNDVWVTGSHSEDCGGSNDDDGSHR